MLESDLTGHVPERQPQCALGSEGPVSVGGRLVFGLVIALGSRIFRCTLSTKTRVFVGVVCGWMMTQDNARVLKVDIGCRVCLLPPLISLMLSVEDSVIAREVCHPAWHTIVLRVDQGLAVRG